MLLPFTISYKKSENFCRDEETLLGCYHRINVAGLFCGTAPGVRLDGISLAVGRDNNVHFRRLALGQCLYQRDGALEPEHRVSLYILQPIRRPMLQSDYRTGP